jgi:DNA-binding response OmpR family regulator
MPRSVLIIEDNCELASLLQSHLADMGVTSRIALDGRVGLAAFRKHHFDLVILDVMLPELDGLSICRSIRSDGAYVPILMLTAKTSELDRVLGLELGADDYMCKPFSVRELMARINALFRRVESMTRSDAHLPCPRIELDGLVVDLERREVKHEGVSLALTSTEFDLLAHFARHPGRVYSRTQLLDAVWGYQHDGYEHTVNTHINRLRAKLEPDPAHPQWILTVWGVGYKLADVARG